MIGMISVAGSYALVILAALIVTIGLIAICSGWLSEPAGLPNRVSQSENSDGQKRNKYGETHEMWDMRVTRYWEELHKIEKRRDHLMKLIHASDWKPRR